MTNTLIDSSAWIASFKKDGFESIKSKVTTAIANGQARITQIIILELLQGTKTAKEKSKLRELLQSIDILELDNKVWERAYNLSFHLRRKGVTIPTIDTIIASIAIENDCVLLHYDRHFPMVAKHFPDQLYLMHKFVFTGVIYGFVFFLWFLWVKKLAR